MGTLACFWDPLIEHIGADPWVVSALSEGYGMVFKVPPPLSHTVHSKGHSGKGYCRNSTLDVWFLQLTFRGSEVIRRLEDLSALMETQQVSRRHPRRASGRLLWIEKTHTFTFQFTQLCGSTVQIINKPMYLYEGAKRRLISTE